MTHGANRTLIDRLYAEGINRHDARAAAAFYAEHAAVRDDLGMLLQLGRVDKPR